MMRSIVSTSVARVVMTAVVVSSSVLSVPVIAAESDLGIEEIIVTARKKEESVQDVPIAMTALSQELHDSTIRNLSDVNGYSSNVIIRQNPGRARASTITIRGVTSTSSGDKSFDSPIAVSLDGVFFGTVTGQIVENFDLERVEILRGPQGTLFGKNTVGGVISVFRTKPTGELGGKAKLTAGRYGNREVRALVNFPIFEDTLAAKLFYAGVKNDGYLTRTFDGGKAPEKDYENFGVTLLWTPSDSFEALLTIERYNDHSDTGAPTNYNVLPGYFPKPTGADLGRVQDLSGGTIPCNLFRSCRLDPEKRATSVETNQPNKGRYRNDVYSLNMHYDINENLSLVSVTGYHDTPYEDTISELDGTKDDFIYIDNDNVYEQFSQEIRLEGTYERFDFVVGSYYFESQYDQDWVTAGTFWNVLLGGLRFDTPAGLDLCLAKVFGVLTCDPRSRGQGLGPNYDQRLFQTQKADSLAFFTQVDYEVTDKLIVTAGIRYTDETKHFKGYQAYQGSRALRYPFNFDIGHADLKNNWKETTMHLGVTYHFTEDVMFYGTYSEGFKSGGFFGVNQNIRDFVRNQYDPEFAKSYEVGMKAQFMDNRLQVNATGFYNDFEDKQDSNVVNDAETNTVATVFENIGGLEYLGLELETRFVVSEHLDIFSTAGWLDAKYNGFFSKGFIPIQDLRPETPAQNVDFLTPKLAPEWTFGVGGTYTMEVGPGELSLQTKWNYVSKQETDTFNDPGTQFGAQKFLNAQIGYVWDKFRLVVFGQNLTNERQEISGFLPGLFGTGGVGPGATYGVEVEASL